MKLPVGYRRWVFVGAPLTPNALNNGSATFPEYHHVYIGHHPLPYEPTAAEQPVEACAGCHLGNVAKTDMTYIQFYPILRDKDKVK